MLNQKIEILKTCVQASSIEGEDCVTSISKKANLPLQVPSTARYSSNGSQTLPEYLIIKIRYRLLYEWELFR
jgi:hypothetical protein